MKTKNTVATESPNNNPRVLTPAALRRAADLAEQLEKGRQELNAILGGAPVTPSETDTDNQAEGERIVHTKNGQTRHYSTESIEGIRAGQKARWAKVRKAKREAAKAQVATPAAPTAPAPAPVPQVPVAVAA